MCKEGVGRSLTWLVFYVLAGYLAYRDSYPCIVLSPMESNPFVRGDVSIRETG
jgi:hypothetical protein